MQGQYKLQLKPIPQKITVRLREGVKATLILGRAEAIPQIVTEHSSGGAQFVPPPINPPEIYDREFYECDYIIDIEINDIYERIGVFAFYKCVNLEMVTIGKNMKEIDICAFAQCSKLKQIKYFGSIQEWEAIIKGADWKSQAGDFSVVCTNGTLTKHQS